MDTGQDTARALTALFVLEGEDVRWRLSGRLLTPNSKRALYKNVSLGGGVSVGYHRIKFFLLTGLLPPMVDHADGNTRNNSGSNLRAATRSENMQNQPLIHSRRDLPRGVYRRENGKFQAKAWDGKRYHSLGTHLDPASASALVEAKLREVHGSFYRAELPEPLT